MRFFAIWQVVARSFDWSKSYCISL